jgi:hypothetical protein
VAGHQQQKIADLEYVRGQTPGGGDDKWHIGFSHDQV